MRRTGFTLTELIVVVAVLALLLVVLSPSLYSSREQAKTVKCSSNIKQLLLLLADYGATSNCLPYGFNDERKLGRPPGDYAGNHLIDRMGWWWFDCVAEVCDKWKGERTILRCPANRLTDPVFDGDVLCGNYGVNQSICKAASDRGFPAEFEGVPLSFTLISRPSETLIICDAGYSLINWWHVTDQPPRPLRSVPIEETSYVPGLSINSNRALWPAQRYDALSGRHPNKTVNIGFADSHVSREAADRVLVEKAADSYKNRSPLWCPE